MVKTLVCKAAVCLICSLMLAAAVMAAPAGTDGVNAGGLLAPPGQSGAGLCGVIPPGGDTSGLLQTEVLCQAYYENKAIMLVIMLAPSPKDAQKTLDFTCAAETCTTFQIGQVGYTFVDKGIHLLSSRGCYYFSVLGPQSLYEKLIAYQTQIDEKIKTIDSCAAPPVGPPGSSTTLTGFDTVGLGCSGDPAQTGQNGRVVCSPVLVNEPGDDPASFSWMLDGQAAGGSSRQFQVDGVTAGEHAVTVTATWHGVQISFTGLVLVSDGTKPPDFTLSASCQDKASDNNRTLTCQAAPTDSGSLIDSLAFEWFLDGAKVDNCPGSTCMKQNLDKTQNLVQVQATGPKSGEKSNLVSVVASALPNAPAALAGNGQLSVQGPGGTAVVSPGQQTDVTVNPGQKSEVYGKCEKLRDLFLMISLTSEIDPNYFFIQTPRGPLLIAFVPILFNCIRLYGALPPAFGPVAAGVDGAAGWAGALSSANRAPAAALDLPVQLTIRLTEGPLRLGTKLDNMALTVETAAGAISVQGINDFAVEYVPANNAAVVVVYQGKANVQPQGGAAGAVTVSAGQAVKVSQGKVETLTSLTASTPTNPAGSAPINPTAPAAVQKAAPALANSPLLQMLLGGVVGSGLLLVILVFLVTRRRR